MPTAPPKSFPKSSRVMAFAAPAARVVEPATLIAPNCVTAPAVVTARLPEIVETPRTIAPELVSATSPPLVIPTNPANVLPASASVMSLAEPAARVVVPLTARVPLCVIAPAVVTDKSPEIVEAPRSISSVSLSVTFRPVVIDTAPPKSLASSRVMALALPAASVVVPMMSRAPESVIVPLAVTARFPEIVEAPRSIAPVSLSVTSSAAVTLTAPPN